MTESMYQPPLEHETTNALGERPANVLSQPAVPVETVVDADSEPLAETGDLK